MLSKTQIVTKLVITNILSELQLQHVVVKLRIGETHQLKLAVDKLQSIQAKGSSFS